MDQRADRPLAKNERPSGEAVSVQVGLGVLRELLEAEVDEIVGPKSKWNPDRSAVRHGH